MIRAAGWVIVRSGRTNEARSKFLEKIHDFTTDTTPERDAFVLAQSRSRHLFSRVIQICDDSTFGLHPL